MNTVKKEITINISEKYTTTAHNSLKIANISESVNRSYQIELNPIHYLCGDYNESKSLRESKSHPAVSIGDQSEHIWILIRSAEVDRRKGDVR